jgi:orotidine-5'-phosphate decarboxylase
MKFIDKLTNAAQHNRSWLCVGLDPDLNKLPNSLPKNIDGISKFLKEIIDSTNDIVCAYKPNSAFYERFGAEGVTLLKEIIDYIPKNIPVILDAKRGDIGNTSKMYAVSAFEHLEADALTVNPYMGYDCIKPFIDYQDKGVFILCLTSNPSSADFQKRKILSDSNTPQTIYESVANKALSWNTNTNIGLVVGATAPSELSEIRKLIGEDLPILIPGIGAQGGDLETSLKMGSNSNGQLAIINVSRSVLYASTNDDFASKSKASAMVLVKQMRKLLF